MSGLIATLARSLGRKSSQTAVTHDPIAIHALVAMSQIAVADGREIDHEITTIADIMTRLTGRTYGPTTVAHMLEKLDPRPEDLAQVGEDLSDKDRQIVLEAALNIAVISGEIHAYAYGIVTELAQQMRIGADAFRAALARISAHLHAPQHA